MGNGSELWTEFKDAFLAEVRSLAQEGLLGQFWGTETGRTKMYTERIVPGIGQRLGLEYVPEWLNIDGGYWDRGLARIFLETENNAQITYQEMDKLCHVRAPLKVLITVAPWPDTRLKQSWLHRIRELQHFWPESADAVYGFAVGEAKGAPDEKLVFHFFSASPDGNGGPEEEHLVGKF